jgi:hypothetical protein
LTFLNDENYFQTKLEAAKQISNQRSKFQTKKTAKDLQKSHYQKKIAAKKSNLINRIKLFEIQPNYIENEMINLQIQ